MQAAITVAAVAIQEIMSLMRGKCAGSVEGSDFELAAEFDDAQPGEGSAHAGTPIALASI